ncbi:MAG TPA: AAA family ATPase [Candidatus Caccomorpha excrementavium]|nr:AAA family ATPase [Candidatus Caccomorpha excrementavium]
MARTVGIGIQSFREIIENDCFYIDKTDFIREWWESRDSVTLITRPRRFGKTLTMSMTEQFFSVEYAGRGDLFEGLEIWKEEAYRQLQGTYPVISLTFANVKETNYETTSYRIRQLLMKVYEKNAFLRQCEQLSEAEKIYFEQMASDMSEKDAPLALYNLSDFLFRYYGKKVIILLDEYDTPMQEAYVDGYWNELTAFTRSLFNSTFKTNPWLERAIMTGITRISKESVFSDLNNLKVITATSDEYAASFGFTEEEVFAAMDEYGYEGKEKVKYWYDGFVFGGQRDIYNPWSILNYLDTGKLRTYWANTSSNSLVSKLIREGDRELKTEFESLLQGEALRTRIEEQIVYNQLDTNEEAIWSLLLAAGYLKAVSFGGDDDGYDEEGNYQDPEYELELTNFEVRLMFQRMVGSWFSESRADYNDFIRALLLGDIDAMNTYMNRVTLATFSYFDTGKGGAGEAEPERFYHGFVLGLMVELRDRYALTSNRESGFGRYDVMLEPLSRKDDAIIIEFKVFNPRKEKDPEETLRNARKQIEDRKYETALLAKGIPADRIRKYGFVFEGKTVLIG